MNWRAGLNGRWPHVRWSRGAHHRESSRRVRTIWVGAVAYDPKVVTIWEGMRRYFHEGAHASRLAAIFNCG